MSMFEDLKEGLEEIKAQMAGKDTGARVHLPVDVKAVRKDLKMTQNTFANSFGFSVDAVRHWEAGRRNPESAAQSLLRVISHSPETVLRALHPEVYGLRSRTSFSVKERRASRTLKDSKRVKKKPAHAHNVAV